MQESPPPHPWTQLLAGFAQLAEGGVTEGLVLMLQTSLPSDTGPVGGGGSQAPLADPQLIQRLTRVFSALALSVAPYAGDGRVTELGEARREWLEGCLC